jgi:hypothetical protein
MMEPHGSGYLPEYLWIVGTDEVGMEEAEGRRAGGITG